MATCQRCNGSGFLNVEALPKAILESDPNRFEALATNWICDHPESEAEVCPDCLHERLEDFSRVMRNRLFQKGGLAAVREFDLKCRTCQHCGYIAEQSICNCPICGESSLKRPASAN